MDNKRIVIYTAIFGGYDGLLPQAKFKGVDYICFTDRELSSRTWQVRKVTPPCADPTRSARHFKILAHRYLQDYSTSIWVDGNFLVVGEPAALVNTALTKAPMAVFDHAQCLCDPRGCLFEEHESILRLWKQTGRLKDDPAVMEKQIKRYRDDGYPSHNGLISSAALLRRHHDPQVVATMERWWSELEKGSKRDQLSFNYCAWKENLNYSVIDGDLRDNQWFFMIGSHRKSYAGKLFRYRLRQLLGVKKHGKS